MSYDYDAIVSSIRTLRAEAYGVTGATADGADADADADAATATTTKEAAPAGRGTAVKVKVEPLSRAVEEFARLSALCPLPPALWIQYATDASRVVELLLDEEGGEKMGVDGDDGGGDGGGGSGEGSRAQPIKVKLDVLETACSPEVWPGCARLRLEHLRTLLLLHGDGTSSAKSDQGEAAVDAARVRAAFEDALHHVGMGTHRSDGDVAEIWRMYASWTASNAAADDAATAGTGTDEDGEDGRTRAVARDVARIFARRALVPLDANDSLAEEVRNMEAEHPQLGGVMDLPVEGHSTLSHAIERGRARTARVFDRYASHEADVRSNMHEEGILESDGGGGRFLMGLGGMGTASAFVSYAKALSSKAAVGATGTDLSGRMYERAASECPTVEDVWVPYVNSLLRRDAEEEAAATATADADASPPPPPPTGVSERACKNCPYSSRLYALKMRCVAAAASSSSSFDGDAILAVAKEAIDAGFLPTAESRLEVHLEACRVIRRHLMETVCADYDEPLTAADSAKGGGDGNKLDGEEVGFLTEDLRDAYDAADEFVRAAYPKWGEGRRLIWRERALAQARVIGPALARVGGGGEDANGGAKASGGGDDVDEATEYFEKSVKTYPKVVGSWRDYASFLAARTPRRRGEPTFRGLRMARDVYRRAVGAASADDGLFPSLCEEFVSFERSFGSYDSLAKAMGMTKAKMRRRQQQPEPGAASTLEVEAEVEVEAGQRGTKRKGEEGNVAPDVPHQDGDRDVGGRKKAKVDHHHALDGTGDAPRGGASGAEEKKKPTNLKVEDPDRHKHMVRIGTMEYPAHPYTVRVSHLSPSTQDMDLVDAFSRCGRVVHARILREKHHGPGYKGRSADEGEGEGDGVKRGKSKGVGLVQFEERESVEEALRLSEEIGIDERLVRVERSNIPASFIVPPGMHRVNPKGRGKNTKKNVKIKASQVQQQRKQQLDETKDETTTAGGEAAGVSVAGDETNEVAKPKQSEPKEDVGGARAPREEVLAFRPRGLAHPRRRVRVEVAPRGTPEKAPDGTSKPG